jgi:hypothetical protein
MHDLLRDATGNLQTCFSGSENTQKLLLRVKTIYHPKEVLQNTRPLVISYHLAGHYFTRYVLMYLILLPRCNIHKLITKTILRIDTIKEISCKTQSMFDTMLSMLNIKSFFFPATLINHNLSNTNVRL